MTVIYDNVRPLYFDSIKQVFDGEAEHTYQLASGHINVNYVIVDGKVERECSSLGSIEVAMTSSMVSNFFHHFPFQKYYSLDCPKLKNCLEHAFELIVTNQNETVLQLTSQDWQRVSFRNQKLYFLEAWKVCLTRGDKVLINKIEEFIQEKCFRDFTHDRRFFPPYTRLH
jgi:hypothetical protein